MGTLTASPVVYEEQSLAGAVSHEAAGVKVTTLLTVLAVFIHGYHPYAEDGGIYLAGIKRLLDSRLYPFGSGFVTAHMRFSLFAPLVAEVVRASSLSLMTVMFILYVASIWMTIFACWEIARRCFREAEARYGAVCLLAVSLTIPVAGTSLMLVDPYLTARSISTPCTLFAIVFALDARQADRSLSTTSYYSSVGLCGIFLFAAALMHPLMTGYCAGCILLLMCISSNRLRINVIGAAAICLGALLFATCLNAYAPAETPGYAQVAATRTYWFLANWRWFEKFGLVAPVAILGIFGLKQASSSRPSGIFLARMGAVAGVTGIVAAMLFAQTISSSLIVARLQPLRIFHTIYFLTILAIGGWFGNKLTRHNVAYRVAVFGVLGLIMFGVQRQIFPHSSHLEVPWRSPTNAWEQAFVWVRDNTPPRAVFALDARFITGPKEDSQNFRAIAERSSLPDFSKDGGVAAIEPDLTAEWISGEASQSGLDSEPDKLRLRKLRHTGADWVVLSHDAFTSLRCDYANQSAKVCQLP